MLLLLLAMWLGAVPAAPASAAVPAAPQLKVYHAAGPGHSVKAIGESGKTVTLEDGSLWAVDPRTQFKVVEWDAGAQISVHLTDEDPDFNYILNNDDVDDWTFVTLISEK
jgi:hypothetical protein